MGDVIPVFLIASVLLEFVLFLCKNFFQEVGMNYISFLMENSEYGEAAKVCSQVLGNNIILWEQIVSFCV